MLWGAHIAGMPIEETALSFAPFIALTGAIAGRSCAGGCRGDASATVAVRAGSGERGEPCRVSPGRAARA
jgi:hypothetical protein